ncbi:MAG: hypothetical protein KJT03_18900, partial [Verrucomicrobiae bacterium]|nr:hypothetical protein [Verrucomicrobiae bacterium]
MTASNQRSLRVSFQTKVLLPVLAFLVLVPVITVWTLDRHIESSGQEDALRSLTTVRAVFRNSLEIRERNLNERFRNMVNEPRFKAVAQLGDTQTMQAFLQDALNEFGSEVQMILFSPIEETQEPSFVQRSTDLRPVNPEALTISTET